MKFGEIKSKIEELLAKSYFDKTFKKEMKTFKKLVLEDKSVAVVYDLYNWLSENKGFSKEYATEYLNMCEDVFKNTTISESAYNELKKWVKDIKVENKYKNIDSYLYKKGVMVESVLEGKMSILNCLTTPRVTKEFINIPMDKMVENANDALANFLSDMDEEVLKGVNKFLLLSETEIKNRYEILSEIVVDKLNNVLKSSEDDDTKKRILETVDKIKSDNVDVISLAKLRGLNDDI